MWSQPARLNADELDFIYLYKLGPDYWSVALKNPRSPLTDYVGSSQLTFVQKASTSAPRTTYRIDGGRFKGFILQDSTINGQHVIALITHRLALETPSLAIYFK